MKNAVWSLMLPLMLSLLGTSGCSTVTVDIVQNDRGNYVYDPQFPNIDSSVNVPIKFTDRVNAAHLVEIRDTNGMAIATGRVLPGKSWTYISPKNAQVAGSRLPFSDPTGSAGGPHNTEHGTLVFVP